MLIYIGYVESKQISVSLTDQFADSLYFLGFLMTIVALIFSLIPYATNIDTLSAETVLSRFGIALLTTAFGLGGRVYYSGFGTSIDQISADTHTTLNERTQLLITEVTLAVDNVGTLRKNIEKELEAVSKSVSANLEAVSKSVSANLEAVTKSVSANVDATTNDVSDEIFSISRRMGEGADKALAKLSATLEQFSEKVANIEVPSNALVGPITEALAGLRNEAAKLTTTLSKNEAALNQYSVSWNNLQNSTEALGAQISAFSSVSLMFQASTERISDFSKSIVPFTETTDELRRQLADVVSEMSRHVEEAKILRGQLQSELGEIAKLKSGLTAEISEAANASKEMNHAIVEGSRFLVQQLSNADTAPGTDASTPDDTQGT